MHYGYLLRGKNSGNVKVGIAKNVKARLSAYRTHYGEPVTLRGTFEFITQRDARAWEVGILTANKERRSHGEWISVDEEVVGSILSGHVGGVVSEEARQHAEQTFLRLMMKTGGKPWVMKRRGAEDWVLVASNGKGPAAAVYPFETFEDAIHMAGVAVKHWGAWWPVGFTSWSQEKQVAWLDKTHPLPAKHSSVNR